MLTNPLVEPELLKLLLDENTQALRGELESVKIKPGILVTGKFYPVRPK